MLLSFLVPALFHFQFFRKQTNGVLCCFLFQKKKEQRDEFLTLTCGFPRPAASLPAFCVDHTATLQATLSSQRPTNHEKPRQNTNPITSTSPGLPTAPEDERAGSGARRPSQSTSSCSLVGQQPGLRFLRRPLSPPTLLVLYVPPLFSNASSPPLGAHCHCSFTHRILQCSA